jgi:hypothetical protein
MDDNLMINSLQLEVMVETAVYKHIAAFYYQHTTNVGYYRKSILCVKSRVKALEIMDTLSYLGYIEYTLDTKTKKLTYKVMDYVVKCSGEPCLGKGAVYATDGYGFLCLPRNITQRLAEEGYTFEEALTVLRQKPGNGELMYKSLFLTYIAPENLSHTEILYRLNISSRHYYRVRQQAINILSIRLWAAPTKELDAWLEVLTLLEVL